MPYVLKRYEVTTGQKVEEFLVETVKLNKKLSLKLLQKGRVIDDKNNRLQKGYVLKSGFIEVSVFQAITKGLKPIFQSEHFAIFDKPSGLIVHPNARSTNYTLLDEIRYHFGDDASLVHRIDAETSGLILVSKNKYSHMILSTMFEEKEFIKKYKAIVQNELKEEIIIDEPIGLSSGLIKIKMNVCKNGKKSQTKIKPISFDINKNQTIVEAIPYTGRQHQIRVHLDYIGYKILGDPIYGLNEKYVDDFLQNKISKKERLVKTGASRLMLHAYYLEFAFFNKIYKFCSKQSFKN